MKMLYAPSVLLCTLLLLVATAVTAQTTRYVAPTAAGSGNGSSWANAAANLQAMIDASASGDAVWVAAGTYKPAAQPTGCTNCATTRDYAFALKGGVNVYGGFAGTETALAQRNIAANATILSGDIGIVNNKFDNCYHVVLAAFASTTPTTRLDGFTIAGGNANGNNSVKVNAQDVYRDDGGGIYTEKGTNTLTNNTLLSNSAESGGGGIITRNGTNTLTNNTFLGNATTTSGGGLYISNGTNTLANNTLSGNSAYTGGGIGTFAGTNTLTNNILSGNSAGGFGGGIYTYFGSNTLINNILSGNSASSGGGITTDYSTNILTNNTFSRNSASIGGGIYTYHGGTNMLTNNIFWGNQQGGSAIVAGADYYADFTNGNTFTNNLLQLASGNYPVSNSGNYAIGTAATGNLFATDPLFVNAADIDGADNLHRTTDDGLSLQAGSPAIDMSNPATTTPPTDITGYTRTGTFDMGAYEYNNPCAGITNRIYVTTTGTGNGAMWATATNNLQAAIDNGCGATEIWVAAGTYTPAAYPTGCTTCATARDYAFALKDGASVYGGFAGTEIALAQRNIAANATILSGNIGTVNDNTDNCHHVVLTAFASTSSTARLDGFTITGGNADGSGSVTVNGQSCYTNAGGGLYISYGTNTLTNNTLSGNSAYNGGGIYTDNSSNMLADNTLSGNTASSSGGGIYIYSGTNTLTNNTLSGNSAIHGGGICAEYGINTLTNNTLSDNSASVSGGGIYTNNSTNMLRNNILWGNRKGGSAIVAGADYYANGANDNTFKNNLLQLASGNYPVSNSGNYAIGTAATGNIFATDPLFVNAVDIDGADNLHRTTDDGLRLSTCSPTINEGDSTLLSAGITTDITHADRIQQGQIDLGAYESGFVALPAQPTIVQSSDTLSIAATTNAIQWLYNGAPIAGATTASLTMTLNGNYAVVVTNSMGCSVTSATINNVASQPVFTLYPNPTQGKLFMIAQGLQAPVHITLIDVLGHQILAATFAPAQLSAPILVSDRLASGLYFVRITAEKQIVTHKVVVE